MGKRVDFAVPKDQVQRRSSPCRSCGKPIMFWSPTAGRSPLDVETAIDDPANPFLQRLESHFAHCPAAASFRRPRGSQDAD